MSIDLDDVQGNVLRGLGRKYRAARHFFLGVRDAAGARRFLRDLPEAGDGSAPGVPSSEEWKEGERPGSCLNVGITWLGLKSLGVPASVLAKFPQAFQDGPAVRARVNSDRPKDVGLGDVGRNAPDGWIVGGLRTPAIHVVVSLYARDPTLRETASEALRARFAASGLTEHSHHDADLLEKPDYVHFGYRDGIAQPQIEGGPAKKVPDRQPPIPAGDLLLGREYVNSFYGNYAGDLPRPIVDNATYGAFRIVSQDVQGFEALLSAWADATRLPDGYVAAKIMGRWRNGVPLVLSPETATPEPRLPHDRLNDFDYVSEGAHTALYDDSEGRRCPIGAHVRRLNPRRAAVMGTPHSRRLMRRSMPYGPALAAGATDDDGVDRGLIGYFLCGDLEAQFEFIQRVWVNGDFATSGIRGTREPIMGTQPDDGGAFTAHLNGSHQPTTLRGLPTLVTTRGSAYCLLPGIGGLRYLASLPDPKAVHG
jgi:deferrochelatase/peroxidase EfeB